MKCLWCGDSLVFSWEEWKHSSTGTSYIARCDACGWIGGAGPILCPNCGGEVRDDHCAFPVLGQGQDSGQSQDSGSGQGWIEIKEIRGRFYRYLRWRDGKVKRSKYLGKA